jgi:serine/threonine protein phosphatase PrpC
MSLRIEPFALTDVGLQRDANEDAFDIIPEQQLFVVADGMGGHASGQVASRVAVESIRKYVTELAADPEHVYEYPVEEPCGPPERLLSNAIQWANERVFIESMKDRQFDGMGTTIVCALRFQNVMILGHVGDSRVYRMRSGMIEQVTRDHSLLNRYIDEGRLKTQRDIDNFPEKNIILKALGLRDYVEPEISVVGVESGDVWLLCSDGLSDQVDDWIISNVIEGNEDDLDQACCSLVKLANEAGGKDNCTVMLLKVEEAMASASSLSSHERAVLSTVTTEPAMRISDFGRDTTDPRGVAADEPARDSDDSAQVEPKESSDAVNDTVTTEMEAVPEPDADEGVLFDSSLEWNEDE